MPARGAAECKRTESLTGIRDSGLGCPRPLKQCVADRAGAASPLAEALRARRGQPPTRPAASAGPRRAALALMWRAEVKGDAAARHTRPSRSSPQDSPDLTFVAAQTALGTLQTGILGEKGACGRGQALWMTAPHEPTAVRLPGAPIQPSVLLQRTQFSPGHGDALSI